MKSVILIRHAKSNWDDPEQRDFDRPLNKRGHQDAPEMAERLHKRVPVDAFLSSTANRAWTTAAYFAKAYGVPETSIVRIPALYHAEPEVFARVIAEASDTAETIAVFAHNPGITAYANELGTARIDDMPTCALFAVQADIQSWKDFAAAEKKFWFFDYPKA